MQKETSKSVRRAFSILMTFSADCRKQNLTEISQKLGLPLSTTSRIVSVLCELGFLQKDDDRKVYRLGPALYYLSSIAREDLEVRNVALPFMRKLRDTYKETVNLYILDGDHRVCIEQVESPLGLRRAARIGDRLPLWAGSSGRCFLAYMEKEEVERILSMIKPFSSNTITDKNEIYRRLEKIRREGYDISNSEREEGVATVASPIFDSMGKVVACLAIAGPSFRVLPVGEKLAKAVVESAREISRRMGYMLPQSKSYTSSTS
ncbi:MAG: IclR family transcriptional regulator [Synergistetes bacterium]|nr:IclR family transcriptional regulator [Synergistota bacterium]MDK2870853.1 IclR family transcriptional regulator, regulon repressor [bacterium]